MIAARQETPVVALVGPTAVGKSAVAMVLAREHRAEIVCADSMQVYRGMDIGTSKPSSADRREIPHHMLDVADIGESFSVAQYQSLARAAVAGVHARGRLPIVVGGSGLYLRSLLEELTFAPGSPDSDVRAELEELARQDGPGALHERLSRLDPAAALAIDERNVRRVIRALEGIYGTGELWSDRLATWRDRRPTYSCLTVGLDVERADLYAKIDARADRMLADGWLEEVRALMHVGLASAPTASRALGYRQLIAHLSGSIGLEEAVADTKRATRAFAKRQSTWFRADSTIHWIDAAGRTTDEVATHVSELTVRFLDGRLG